MAPLSSESLVEKAVESSLSSHLDSDICDYIVSLLGDNPNDSDSRDAVVALISEGVEDDDPIEICTGFFQLLDLGSIGDDDHQRSSSIRNDTNENKPIRKLDQAITMKKHDIETFASGLTAAVNDDGEDPASTSNIATFYANMIDISNNQAAMSERDRRKSRQKKMREEMEEQERQRAIEDAMKMLDNDSDDDADGNDNDFIDREEKIMEKSTVVNSCDVHFRNLDLPNLRGGGPDLLQNTSLILSKGRRYGLMGRNGCGKTTLMSFIARREIKNAVPKNMSMLLVRQEIIGNDMTAVETVLKSDVKRESIKRFISWCETEIDNLENKTTNDNEEKDDVNDEKDSSTTKCRANKGRQKLRERKKQNMQRAARAKIAHSKKLSASSKETQALSNEEKKQKLNVKLAKAYERFAQMEQEEGGDPEPRARKVLHGLGFTTEMQNKPTSALSGGWRMRVSLSCALFANPSLLLLDEPTNHLDLEAVLWLEQYLTSSFTGTLVVVSHDRHFLNEVVTDVVHFHRSQLTTYRGDISNFECVVEEQKQRQIRLREIQENKRAHLQKYIDLHAQAGENGVKAARQRKSKMKKLDKLGVMSQDGKKWKSSYDGDADEVEEFVEDDTVILKFPDPGSFDGDMVRLEEVMFGYDGNKILLNNIDLSINSKSRVALLGRNGCGKSTLIKLVVGAIQPMKGKVAIDGRAKIEYLAQHQLEQLDPDSTPMQTMIDRYPADRSNSHIHELRRYLANFGIDGDVLPKQRIHTMSGGQKCRLCLACSMYRKPHLLILDEPTNHLDLETTEALIDAIDKFEGGVLLVSHDQHLLTSVCKDLYVVENGTIERLRGSTNGEAFQSYKKAVIQGRR